MPPLPTDVLPGADTAFVVVFSLFVVAFLALVVITLTWAIRRDRVGRAEWMARRKAAEKSARGGRPQVGPAQDGRVRPLRDRRRGSGGS